MQDRAIYKNMAGKTAVVTGATSPMGRATCRAFAANAVKLVINARTQAKLNDLAQTLREEGAEVLASAADCATDEGVTLLRKQTQRAFGTADYLLAFAGGGQVSKAALEEISEEEWQANLDGHLTATWRTLKAFLPDMRAQKSGVIVTMASAGARVFTGAPTAYVASKAGIMSLTRQLAREAGAAGIRVNCLAPASIMTDEMENGLPKERAAQLRELFPLGRIGRPEDVAGAALFLCSDSASWISGVTLDIAGGMVML